MINKKSLLRWYWVFSTQFGIDPIRFVRTIISFPFYLRTIVQFKKEYKGKISLYPCLQDKHEESGSINSEYFWQDLIVSNWVFKANPIKHVDIGSRVDGFVAHVASFREIEVIDVRPIKSVIPNIIFRQGNMMDVNFLHNNRELHIDYCDSLSCLHTIEHFGLGRYGDPIDAHGYKKGLVNMTSLVKKGGLFYLSTPIGKERVEFNANWVFSPNSIIYVVESQGFVLNEFHIYNNGIISKIDFNIQVFEKLSNEYYNLGIFVFKKI
jgi:hypothetical protein